MSEKEETVVTAGFDPRHLSALAWIQRTDGFFTKVDALRRATIKYAKELGWPDPFDQDVAMPPAPRKARQ